LVAVAIYPYYDKVIKLFKGKNKTIA